jgi:hypothetical protein
MKKSVFEVVGFLSFCFVIAMLVMAATPTVRFPTSATTDTMTRPADATAYAAGDVMGESPVASYYTFTPVAASSLGTMTVTQASLQVDTGVVTTIGQTRLHLFKAAPTAQLDNAAFSVPAADRANYLGYVTMETPIVCGDTAISTASLDFKAYVDEGARTLYGVLQAVTGFTPATGTSQKVTIHTQE